MLERSYRILIAAALCASLVAACGDGDNDGIYDPDFDPINCIPADCLDVRRPSYGGTMSCTELGFPPNLQCYAFAENERFCCEESSFP